MLEKLEKAREHVAQGMYKNAYDVSSEMNWKFSH